MKRLHYTLPALFVVLSISFAGCQGNQNQEVQAQTKQAYQDSSERSGESQEMREEKGENEKAEEKGEVRYTFEDVEVGALPAGWKAETTNPRERQGKWSIVSDTSGASGSKVLRLVDTGTSHGSTFNLCWTDQVGFNDGTVEVKVKAGTGREDQGGGPIWRVQDRDNYYIARWNPLEDNFRLYYVKNSDRRQLASERVKLDSNAWHDIRIEHRGSHIACYLDNQKLLEADDTTFTNAGGVGVWTKADAATSFDDFEVYPGSETEHEEHEEDND